MKKKMVQSDFDGTLTQEDVSFQILDAFADHDWRRLLEEYKAGKRSVLSFTRESFIEIKETEKTVLEFVEKNARIRDGVKDLVDYCSQNDFRFVIVSNGLDLYIKFILEMLGLKGIPVFAARTHCKLEGMEISYVGPEGNEISDGFKTAYIRSFLNQGYQVAYIGDGISDFPPVKLADRVFARSALLESCQKSNLGCMPFDSLKDVVSGLEGW